MHSPIRSHAFLHFLTVFLSLCLVLNCHSACTQTPPKASNPSNGQYGTPNLPNAVSNFIDWNRMRIQANGSARNSTGISQLYGLISGLDLNYLFSGTPADLITIIKQLSILLAQLKLLSGTSEPDQYQSIYAGVEMRGGSGRTDYIIPDVTYSNEFAGYDVGADFLTESGDHSHYDSFGLSVRYEVTNQGRALIKEIQRNAKMNAEIRYELIALEGPIGTLISNNTKVKEGDPNLTLLQRFQHDVPIQPLLRTFNKEAIVKEQMIGLTTQVNQLTHDTNDLGDHVVRQSLSPALSAFAGARFINSNGNITSQGLSASQLFTFGKGLPGVTLLYVVEDLQASLPQSYRHNALQQGAALIFQDRTPAVNENYTRVAAGQSGDYRRSDTNTKYLDLLQAPWRVKIGVEYTTPVFGLTKAYTGFVRYRDPSSYADITLAYGEDGTGKNYGSLSIGRSYLF